MIRCVNYAVCGTVIENPDDHWWEVIGWTHRRKSKQGGTNALFKETRTGSHLCNECQARLRFSGHTGQGDLFDDGT